MIALIGFMGAGKSTVGRLLSEHLQLPFLDSDDLIEQRLLRRPRLGERYAARLPTYQSLATVTVHTDGRPPEQVAAEVLAALARSA